MSDQCPFKDLTFTDGGRRCRRRYLYLIPGEKRHSEMSRLGEEGVESQSIDYRSRKCRMGQKPNSTSLLRFYVIGSIK